MIQDDESLFDSIDEGRSYLTSTFKYYFCTKTFELNNDYSANDSLGGFKFEAQRARVIDETPLRVF